MSFFMDQSKTQQERVPVPEDAAAGAIVSADTLRENRIPPGQQRTKKWPVLDAWGPPAINAANWKLRVFGLVREPVEWTWEEFNALPRVRIFADFHCVTRWSRLG
ncbi:MAG TPA: molybdopterin-dependent oxidoreductase, partial [Bryobacteraceae bacterium]|nr:molybdopterin-dependent oxidoreductase [Bryobacteraceae bacterium]